MKIVKEQGLTLKSAKADVLYGLGQQLYAHLIFCLFYFIPFFSFHLLQIAFSVQSQFLILFVEFVERACGMTTLLEGNYITNAATGIDTCCTREPLGVCAGICISDFSPMIPLWVCLSSFSALWMLLLYSSGLSIPIKYLNLLVTHFFVTFLNYISLNHLIVTFKQD